MILIVEEHSIVVAERVCIDVRDSYLVTLAQ